MKNRKRSRNWKKKAGLTGVSLLAALQLVSSGSSLKAVAAEGNPPSAATEGKRQMEFLDRGLVAVQTPEGNFVSWRLLGTDPEDVAFHLYRDGRRLTDQPLTSSTNYLDAAGTPSSRYTVKPVVNGKEQETSEPAGVWGQQYRDIPLKKPADGVNPDGSVYTYSANDASLGDVDGDGLLELILKWDPSNSKDNSQNGVTGPVYVDAYRMDGTFLWRIDLGRNIRAGAHYTQLMVYDLDGDGKAEVACKTADGTVDGTGKVIGDPAADYRNSEGRILAGPEFLTIFEGATGKELTSVPYEPPRGTVTDWGDGYGNRVDRFLAGIAYLDGERPSLIMARGYYTRAVLAAYNWRDGELSQVWTFDSNDPGNEGYRGQGNHNLSVADVDGDGKDEIIYGAAAIDHNGKGLYTTGLGHGDALHVGDLDPTRPGLEVVQVHEDKKSPYGLEFRDAATGESLWGVYTGKDTGRGMSADLDPRYPGEEAWAAGISGLFSATGQKISETTPSSINFGIWWDGDLQRELLDHTWNGTTATGVGKIDKWDYENSKPVRLLTADGTLSNNYTKGTPVLQADLIGDWREEVIWRTEDSTALRLYTTTSMTEHRLPTLLHDSVYRLGIAWQNVAYNQPPHTSYFLGAGMTQPPHPSLYVNRPAEAEIAPRTLDRKSSGQSVTIKVTLSSYLGGASGDASSLSLLVAGKELSAESVKAEGTSGDNGFSLMAKVDRSKLIEALGDRSGEQTVEVTGQLEDGTRFHGTASLTVN
ncbi:rhamnogalacturonan lyase [Paenibacillus aurantius]|uniref:Rhamnogalacturonan lyase n=1 Tax=Paenibacillus aurantius TaxID=2918900 RepID=A0AA96L9I2_9BACL|nr:rhamnogalacturonan lyase [Paenibacillus aurantius]WNQ09502.1 rhamnogalacturonan lyase [Paenibacillus aurantius]